MPKPTTTTTTNNTKNIGNLAEDFALKFLKKRGFKLIERNFRRKGGEIDLVMKHNQDLVFIEVRYRSGDQFGDGGESVNFVKQRKLRIAAELWLQKNEAITFLGCRFDVISVSGQSHNFVCEWIDDAFE